MVPLRLAVFPQRLDVDSVRVVQAAVHFDDADHFVAGFRHQAGGVRSHVAEALNDDARGLAD